MSPRVRAFVVACLFLVGCVLVARSYGTQAVVSMIGILLLMAVVIRSFK